MGRAGQGSGSHSSGSRSSSRSSGSRSFSSGRSKGSSSSSHNSSSGGSSGGSSKRRRHGSDSDYVSIEDAVKDSNGYLVLNFIDYYTDDVKPKGFTDKFVGLVYYTGKLLKFLVTGIFVPTALSMWILLIASYLFKNDMPYSNGGKEKFDSIAEYDYNVVIEDNLGIIRDKEDFANDIHYFYETTGLQPYIATFKYNDKFDEIHKWQLKTNWEVYLDNLKNDIIESKLSTGWLLLSYVEKEEGNVCYVSCKSDNLIPSDYIKDISKIFSSNVNKNRNMQDNFESGFIDVANGIMGIGDNTNFAKYFAIFSFIVISLYTVPHSIKSFIVSVKERKLQLERALAYSNKDYDYLVRDEKIREYLLLHYLLPKEYIVDEDKLLMSRYGLSIENIE